MNFSRRLLFGLINDHKKSKAAQRLQESEEKYRLIMEYSPLGVFHFDSAGLITAFNKRLVTLLGSSEEYLRGLNLLELPDKKLVEVVKGTLKGLLTSTKGDYRSVASGKVTTVRGLFAPLFDERNRVTGGVALVEDISEQIRAEKKLQESEKKYREILATMEDGYYEVNLRGVVTGCNEAAARLLGLTQAELIGLSYTQLCKNANSVYEKYNEAFKTGEPKFSVSAEMLHKNGDLLFAELSLSLIRNKRGRVTGFRGLGRNVTERVLYEKQLKYLSFHDQLTGLYNRLYFENELERLKAGREYPLSIISIDVDDLKVVNDTKGHAAGDELLKACAETLKISLRVSDILARYGGDEFVAILPLTDEATCATIVERINKQVEELNQSSSATPLSISIGFTSVLCPGDSLDEKLKEADDLMYRHKFSKDQCSS